MAYATHVPETARLIIEYLPDRLTVAHAPLIRSIFEKTMTLAWVDEVDDGAEALMTEEARQRRNLARCLMEIGDAENAAMIRHQEDQELDTSSLAQGRYFEQLTKDIGLENAYTTYRVLSSLAHPSIQVADSYLDSEDGDQLFLRSRGRALSHGAKDGWGYLIAMCLVWSGYVANYLDPNRTRRSELRRVARELGVLAELPIRLEAIQRVERQRREARRRASGVSQ
ncbi:DUF5677 domain-containing protein [Brachybacterium conglomeratum]|uniref:DUF5677 domain-containing protein n=1 Tax=Brachybacterium conglomeratum TaxID=47846 RepID=UPI003DA1A924